MPQNPSNLAVVFDFDGTLVDSMGGFATVASGVICKHFGKTRAWGHTRYLETSGLPFPFQLEKMFPGDLRIPEAVAEYDRIKIESYGKASFFPDVKPALEWLCDQGVGLAISSNNDFAILEKKLGPLASLFDCVAGFEPGFLKGDKHFEWIRARLRDPAMIFIGDSLHDAVMAHKNNIPFYARLGTFTEDDFRQQGIAAGTLDSFSKLKNLVGDFHGHSSLGRRDGDQAWPTN
ncbi:MAG: HAD hydrolase-like protein [Deltaproteobacteria bacterium]|nr:HAD hydrolase-like protein [Deltaproteobacteria bacterium]